MNRLPRKCVVDTNVPKTANLATNPSSIPVELADCVMECVKSINHVVNKGRLVIDAKDEIFDEYRNELSMSGQPGVGDVFLKWVHDNRWKFPKVDRVQITKVGSSYKEFPKHHNLTQVDVSDRKFIAVANAHPDKPPILQATDSKWFGWKGTLLQVGITVHFLCLEYVKAKYLKKISK